MVIAARTGSNEWEPHQAKLADDHRGKPNSPEPTNGAPVTVLTSHGCVLVVDDNQAVRETLADILEADGFDPIQAEDATQALTIMRGRNDIAALVTDLSMPGADGITLIRRARKIYPDLPAILLTGYAEEAAAVSTIAGGDYHVLSKPVQSERLIEQIFLLIARARAA